MVSKTIPTLLRNHMNSPSTQVHAVDLYTITTTTGDLLRLSGGDTVVRYDSKTWALGPLITRGQINATRGLQAKTLTITINPRVTDTSLVFDVPWMTALMKGLFAGANVYLERLYAKSITLGRAGTWLGSVPKFSGSMGIGSITPLGAEFVCKDKLVLLEEPWPIYTYKPSCPYSVYDAQCRASKSGRSVNDTVYDVTDSGMTIGAVTGGFTGNAFRFGMMTFTTGANAGHARMVKSNGSSTISLVAPFPADPAPGDAFTLLQGCDKSLDMCVARFNNRQHFGGFPFIPSPETTT